MPNHAIIAIPCLLCGGTEMQTLNLARALISGGYKVTVCCYYEYDDRMVDSFKDTGADTVLMELDRSQGLFCLNRRLKTLFNKIKPDIIHVQYMAPGFVPVLAARVSGIRTVFATVHQPGRPYGLKAKLLLRTAAVLSNVFFCVSRSVEQSWFGQSRILEPGTAIKSKRQHFTLYNAVDAEQIRANLNEADRSALKNMLELGKGPVVGVVGRLRWEKGQDILIKAMKIIAQNLPDASLLVVGDGPDKEKYMQVAQDCDVQKHIRWVGHKPPESIIAYYAIMDVAVVPSRFEGFGLAAAEAMAAGLPVVASDVDGLREVVENGKTGYLATSGDSSMMAERIISLVSDPTRASAMGRAGRERIARYFSLEIFTETILNVYRQFI